MRAKPRIAYALEGLEVARDGQPEILAVLAICHLGDGTEPNRQQAKIRLAFAVEMLVHKVEHGVYFCFFHQIDHGDAGLVGGTRPADDLGRIKPDRPPTI